MRELKGHILTQIKINSAQQKEKKMKKSLIAGASVSALGLAAMPVLGVFAATSTVTDTITVSIASSCAVTTVNSTGAVGDGLHTDRTYNVAMHNSELRSDIGGTAAGGNAMSIACPDNTAASSWKLTAVGGDASAVSTVMKAGGAGTDIATGTAISGDVSNWAMKVAGSGVTIENGFDNFVAVPATPTVVAQGTGSMEGAFVPNYQIWISATQESDTYTGKVTYTLTNPNV